MGLARSRHAADHLFIDVDAFSVIAGICNCLGAFGCIWVHLGAVGSDRAQTGAPWSFLERFGGF